MVDGPIKPKSIYWEKYLSPNFRVNNYPRRRKWNSCGTITLSLLTDLTTSYIDRFCPEYQYWSNKRLTKFLTDRGYEVIPLSKRLVTTVKYHEQQRIESGHVLVIAAEVDHNSASWFILHNNILWHNDYVVEDFGPLFFLNKPTVYVNLVWHKKWR